MSLHKLVLTGALLCLPFATTATSEWTQTLKRINEIGEMYPGFRQDQAPMSFDRIGSNTWQALTGCKHGLSYCPWSIGQVPDVDAPAVP